MPKSKKTLLSKSSITKQEQKSKKKKKIEQKVVSKQLITKHTSKSNNDSQTNEIISLTTENHENNVITKDFLIIAGSYERILYGIDAHWIKSGEEGPDNVRISKFF